MSYVSMFVYGCTWVPLTGTIIMGREQSIIGLSLAEGRVEQISCNPSVINDDVPRIDGQQV